MSSLDDMLAGMDAWSNAQAYPSKKPAPPTAKQAPKQPDPPPAKKVLKKRKIDQYYDKVEVPESEKQKKAKALLEKLIKPQGRHIICPIKQILIFFIKLKRKC